MVHQLSLVSSIPHSSYIQTVSTLQALTGLTSPQPINTYTLLTRPHDVFKPKFEPGKVNQIEQYHMRCTTTWSDVTSENLDISKPIMKNDESNEIYADRLFVGDDTKKEWTLQISDIPNAGKNQVCSAQNIYESTLVHHHTSVVDIEKVSVEDKQDDAMEIDEPVKEEPKSQTMSEDSPVKKEADDKPEPNEGKLDESKPEEGKADESKPDESKADENKSDESKSESNLDKSKPDETKPESNPESKPESNPESKPESNSESKPDESKEVKSENPSEPIEVSDQPKFKEVEVKKYQDSFLQFLGDLGYDVVNQYWIKGIRFFHGDIVIEIFKIFIRDDSPVPSNGKLKLKLLDESNTFQIKAYLNFPKSTDVEPIKQGTKELLRLQDFFKNLFKLTIPDRMYMDSRVLNRQH